MGRKRKQVGEGEEGPRASLPPCRVCDAPGAGFHYGANTCEACKGFFHRSLKISSSYKCEGNFNCTTEHGSNRLCQFCRFQKCLAVGMAKEAIKTGRYTSIKRTSDILEIQRLQEVKGTCRSLPTDDRPLTHQHSTAHRDNRPIPSDNLYSPNGGLSTTSNSQSPVEMKAELDNVSNINCQATLLLTPMCQDHHSAVSPEAKDSSRQKTCSSFGRVKAEGLAAKLVLPMWLKEKNIPDKSTLPVLIRKPETPDLSRLPDRLALPDRTALPIPHQTEDACDRTTLPEIEFLFSDSPQDLSLLQSQDKQSSLNVCQTPAMSPASVVSPYNSPSDGSQTKHSPSMLTDLASSLLSLSTPAYFSGSLPVSSALSSSAQISNQAGLLHSPLSQHSLKSPATSLLSPSSVSTTSPAPSLQVGTSASLPNWDLYVLDSTSSAGDLAGGDVNGLSITRLYQDKETIIRILLEADENYVLPLVGRWSEEEIKRQQQEHFEACRLQREMFGQLRHLPDHEYDYIFATTGLDTDDRQKRLHIMGASLERVIRAMVKFSKLIPGFSRLDISDKVKLIKYSRQEFCLFTIFKFMDAEKKIMKGLDNQWKCENEMSRMGAEPDSQIFTDILARHLKFCDSLLKLKLSDEELVVIRALVIMAPDRSPHVESATAREIYWELNECLIHMLTRRCPQPLLTFAKIISKLAEARSQTENMIRFFKRLKMDKYSNMMTNPLLREMCSGIFFDEKEDDILHLHS